MRREFINCDRLEMFDCKRERERERERERDIER